KNAVLAGLQLVSDSPRRQPHKVCVRFGMIAHIVSAIGDRAYQFRMRPGKAAHQEKRCRCPVAFQQLQEFWRACRVWPVIEGERDLGDIRSVVQGGAKKFRRRMNGAPGSYSCTSSHSRGDEGPCIHARAFSHGDFPLAKPTWRKSPPGRPAKSTGT